MCFSFISPIGGVPVLRSGSLPLPPHCSWSIAHPAQNALEGSIRLLHLCMLCTGFLVLHSLGSFRTLCLPGACSGFRVLMLSPWPSELRAWTKQWFRMDQRDGQVILRCPGSGLQAGEGPALLPCSPEMGCTQQLEHRQALSRSPQGRSAWRPQQMCVKYSTQVDFPCPLTIVSLVIFLPSLAGVSVEPDGDPGGLFDFEKSEFQHSHHLCY